MSAFHQLRCRLTWLLDCLQVLDDSTDQKTRDLVDDKCLEWRERGIRCECVRRTNRKGYKAGALKDVRPLPTSPPGCHTIISHEPHGWTLHAQGTST